MCKTESGYLARLGDSEEVLLLQLMFKFAMF